jgi:hypothetical protein
MGVVTLRRRPVVTDGQSVPVTDHGGTREMDVLPKTICQEGGVTRQLSPREQFSADASLHFNEARGSGDPAVAASVPEDLAERAEGMPHTDRGDAGDGFVRCLA